MASNSLGVHRGRMSTDTNSRTPKYICADTKMYESNGHSHIFFLSLFKKLSGSGVRARLRVLLTLYIAAV